MDKRALRTPVYKQDEEEDDGDGEYSENDEAVLVFKRRPTIL